MLKTAYKCNIIISTYAHCVVVCRSYIGCGHYFCIHPLDFRERETVHSISLNNTVAFTSASFFEFVAATVKFSAVHSLKSNLQVK